jgi:hypothetical protein
MVIPQRVQDRRAVSRVSADMECRYTYDGMEYSGFVREISLKGALLLSSYMPPHGAAISIRLNASLRDGQLLLDAKVVRRDCKDTERGTVKAFGVAIHNGSLALAQLVTRLAAAVPQKH